MPSTYTPIATTTLGSTATFVDFSSISSAYTDLIVIGNGTSNVTGGSIDFRFNSDTGSNYSFTYLNGDGSSATSGKFGNVTSIPISEFYSSRSNFIAQINNYSNSTTNKTAIMRGNTPSAYVQATVGLWRNTAAINAIRIFMPGGGVLQVGSTFTLYGVKSA